MTNETLAADDGGDFHARVAKIAARLDLPIKEISLPHISRLVAEQGGKLTDAVIADRIAHLVPMKREHFDLRGKPAASPDAPKVRGANLDRENRIAAALNPMKGADKTPTTPREKEWIKKFGPKAALDIANGDGPKFPPFEDESNADE